MMYRFEESELKSDVPNEPAEVFEKIFENLKIIKNQNVFFN